MTAPGAGLDAAAVLRELTLDEKIALLDGADFWHTQPLPERGIESIMLTDGPHGLRKQTAGGDHLGLGDSVPATCFPTAAGLAGTWDPELLHRIGTALGRECRAEGVSVLLGPGLNMKRTPLCGRNFEYFAEDPVLAGRLAAALVSGVQEQGVGTSVKHFAANNQETARMTISAEVDERTLREIYLPAFEHVVRTARPWTVMCSYNRINGVYAAENRWLLTEVLRDEWGFDGLVVSDWGAVDRRDAALAAGLDLEMPSSGGIGGQVVRAAVQEGSLSEQDVDRAALRVLELVSRARPALRAGGEVDLDAHHDLAREAAAASAVLLKNDGDLLPLHQDSAVAVLGELARTPRYQGAGSSQVVPTRLDDALGALESQLPGRVSFAPGYALDGAADPELVAAAVETARRADVAVLFLGLPPVAESEGYDRTDLDLPAAQLELLHAVAAVQDRIVVVLAGGSVVTVDPWQEEVSALLHGWLPGQAGGAALADLLVGAAAPGGRLAETVPQRLAHTPSAADFGEFGQVRYGEGTLIGYRWYDTRELPVSYPFGHGLTYTTFEHRDLAVRVLDDGPQPSVEAEVTVVNTGSRAGDEVVQLYVTDPVSSARRPAQELKAFRKVHLEPGARERVSLHLDSRAFAYWHPRLRRWAVEGGEFELRVGASSRDIRQRAVVSLTGEDISGMLTPASDVGEWLDHPVLGPKLQEALGGGPLSGLFADPQHAMMVRSIPVERLSRFPGFPVSEAALHEWAAQAHDAQR